MEPNLDPDAARGLRARNAWLAAFGLSALWLVVAWCIVGDYGPTWDMAFGDFAQGRRYLEYFSTGRPAHVDWSLPLSLTTRQPAPDFQPGFLWYQIFPFATTLSAALAQGLWHETGLVEPMVAHHLAGPICVALVVFALGLFLARRAGGWVALAAIALWLTQPRYLEHAINNLKDGPESCLYVLAMLAVYVASTQRRRVFWLLAGALTAIALSQKQNALFLPFHSLVFLSLAWGLERFKGRATQWISWKGVGLALLAFVVVYVAFSPQFWTAKPWERIVPFFKEMLDVGNQMTSERERDLSADPSSITWNGALHVLWGTPPTVLILALVGLFVPIVSGRLRIFFATLAFFPVLRVSLPGMRDFDGVRHFIEFAAGLGALAAIGSVGLAQLAAAKLQVQTKRLVTIAAALLAICPSLWATASVHPHGIAYYNSFVGGLAGAQARGIQDATDYWAASYWQAFDWISEHADKGAAVYVPVAPHVARCIAPLKLREDLRLLPENPTELPDPLYVLYILGKGGGTPAVVQLEEDGKTVVHTRLVQGAPIHKIHKLSGASLAEIRLVVSRERRAQAALARLWAWIQAPDVAEGKERLAEQAKRMHSVHPITALAHAVDAKLAESELREVLPKELQSDAEDLIWFFRQGK